MGAVNYWGRRETGSYKFEDCGGELIHDMKITYGFQLVLLLMQMLDNADHGKEYT